MHAYIPFLWASLPPTPSHLLRSSQSSELRFSPFIASSHYNICMIVGQSLCHIQLFVTTWTAACQTSLSFTISQTLLKFLSIKSVMASKHLILCHPLLLLPSIFPGIRVFSNESALHVWWPKYYWSFSFSISLSNEYSGWFPLGWTGLISLQPKDSQASSPTPQLKSIISLVLSFLYSPTLTSIHDYCMVHWVKWGGIPAAFISVWVLPSWG